jgi:hypothetical protein
VDGNGLKRYAQALTLALTFTCAVQATTIDILAPDGDTESVYNAVGVVAMHTTAGGVFSVTVNYVGDQPILPTQTDIAGATDPEVYAALTLPGLPNVPLTGYGILLFQRPGSSAAINLTTNVIQQADPAALRSVTIQYQYGLLAQNVVGGGGCSTPIGPNGCGDLWGTVAITFTGGQFITNSRLNPSVFAFFDPGDFVDAPEPVTLGVTGFALLAIVACKVSRARCRAQGKV